MNLKRLFLFEYTPLIILLVILLSIGIFSLPSYGESWDEFHYLGHARLSMQAYTGAMPAWDVIYRFYGPSFMMLVVLVAKLFPDAILSDVAHALSFLTFLIGLVIFYKLARRFLGVWESYGATLLFTSQPLLWGHAFINPKDTPFTIGFMASIYFGLRMLDSLKLDPPKQPDARLNGILRDEAKSLPRPRRVLLVIGLFLAVGLSIWLATLLMNLQMKVFPPVFSTADFFEMENYHYQITRQFEYILLAVGLLLFFCGFVVSIFLPLSGRHIFEVELKPIAWRVKQALTNRTLLITALIVGLTSSIRFLGLAAAGFIGLLVIWRHRYAAIVPLAVFAGLSFLVMYVTWPYLWTAPFFRFFLTVAVMLRFPWSGKVLFEGQYYTPDQLPYYYLPKLIVLQTTETALICFSLGLLVLVYLLIKRKRQPGLIELAYLCLIWFFLPVLWAVIGNPNLYDNFRQLHFVLPPIFLLGGLGLQIIFSKLRHPLVKIFVLILLVVPGMDAYFHLHPYEYVYYNTFAGQNTFRKYEADYWGTSFREASQYINQIAPAGAKVVVWGPVMPLWAYLRPDISAVGYEVGPIPSGPYYAVVLSRYDNDIIVHPDAPVLFSVKKNGMILVVVKYIEPP